ncbi:CHAT domain-containing protein [Microbispora hainanensis]|uniref:CHAT domain-containing protein n=1 Tax=Microbispora hainanensis TaxID=568844 RepID=A0A544YMA6_9ACTN|nr:CHAT domain-containing tetratricopeptide repeat protein [Microbispora hainanensis]TQS17918.1 CHAT domain-containing protein [Microbispora hainanensis]
MGVRVDASPESPEPAGAPPAEAVLTEAVLTEAVLTEAEAALAEVDRDPVSGLPAAERAARRAARAGHAVAASTAERAWGHALLHVGELDNAIGHLSRAAAWGARAGRADLTAEARYKLAFAILQRGRPQAALREIDAALPDLTGMAAARARAQRAIVLHVMGRLDESLAEFEVALQVLRRHADLLGVQRMLINRALVHSDRHAFAAAERDLLEAETLARALGRPLTIGLIANNLGLMETLRGDVPAALRHLDRAERIIGAYGAQLGTLHQDRAELLLSVGLTAEAKAAAARAVDAYRRERRSLKVPEVQVLLAQAEILSGDPAAALGHARAALRRFRAQGRREWTELARLSVLSAQRAAGLRPRLPTAVIDVMVATLDAAGWPAAALDAAIVAAQVTAGRRVREDVRRDARPDEVWPGRSGDAGDARAGAEPAAGRRSRTADVAADYLSRAAAATRSRGPALVRARGWYARALQRRAEGDARGVLAAVRTGLRVLDEHASAMGATDLRVHAAAHRADLVALGLEVAFEAGRPDGLLEWSERARASRLPAAPVRPPDDPVLTALLARLRSVTRDLAGQAAAPAPLLARQADLERRVRDHSRRLAGTPGNAPAVPVTPRDLAASLGAWALVEYVRRGADLHVLTVVDGRVGVRRLGTTAEAADLIERLTFAVRRNARPDARPEALAASAALLDAAAARLDALLLGPPAEIGDRPLVVVPTGPLHSLPWSLLPSCAGRPVTVAPSATLWHLARTRLAPASGADGNGNGDGGAGVAAGGGVVAVAGPRLPAAGPEAAAVGAIHDGTVLAGAAASVEAVSAALSRAGLAHLAAHGHLSADNPLFSGIALADGPLMAYDVERLPRVPHTLVLAACDSGRSVVRTGDELMGLAVAFLARGTSQLVASVLPIPDAATTPVMVAFHERLAAGRPPAAALAEAQQAVRGDDPRTAAAAAGFVCIGAGAVPVRSRGQRPDRVAGGERGPGTVTMSTG